MNNPNPVPPISDFEANFVNNFGNMSGSIPLPVSFMLTTTSLSSSFLCVMTEITTPPPPSLINFTALFTYTFSRRLDQLGQISLRGG